jgi:hypothetical protein
MFAPRTSSGPAVRMPSGLARRSCSPRFVVAGLPKSDEAGAVALGGRLHQSIYFDDGDIAAIA